MGASVIGRHTHEVCAKNKTPDTLELGDKNIQVNAIAIGFSENEGIKANEVLGIGMARAPTLASRSIKQEMIPEDLVGTLMYLASGDSNFVAGQRLNVDGGQINVYADNSARIHVSRHNNRLAPLWVSDCSHIFASNF